MNRSSGLFFFLVAERERIQRDVPETDKGAPEEKGKAKKTNNKTNREKGEHKKK